MKTLSHGLMIFLFVSGAALAMDDNRPKPDPKEPEKKSALPLEQARAAIAQKDWARAQEAARRAVAADARSADAHNLYAYAIRKGERPDMDLVFLHYNEALRLDPRHLGAHEYLAEAYLMTGNIEKAREHLAVLANLCSRSCEEYVVLERAIGAAERQRARR